METPRNVIAACYSHIQRTFQGRAAEERASQQLIKLCGELYDQDAAKLQLKVLKYLEDQTQAECAFLLLVVPETQELFCQVIGKRILDEEIRFPGQTSSFSVALETKQTLSLDDIPVENRKGIEEVVEIPVRSFLCVPVTSRNDDNLIALACLVNKQNGNRFSERDVTCIRQCFRYTATVLTSTLAFQNERKIKIQTQALLHVAKHLFTNLGKLLSHYNHGLENFPYIRSREWEVNVWGTTLDEAIRSHRFDKKLCRSTRPHVIHVQTTHDNVDVDGSTCMFGVNQARNFSECPSSNKTGRGERPNISGEGYSNVKCGTCMLCYKCCDCKCGNEVTGTKDFHDKTNGILSTTQTGAKIMDDAVEVMKEETECLNGITNGPGKSGVTAGNKLYPCEQVNEPQDEDVTGVQDPTNNPTIVLDDSNVTNNLEKGEEYGGFRFPPQDGLLSPKHPDRTDDGSDYASAKTNCSDESSLLLPEEIDSFLSFQTTLQEFDSTTGDESLRVHCDDEASNATGYQYVLDTSRESPDTTHLYDPDQMESPSKRRSYCDMDVTEGDFYLDGLIHPGKLRMSNSEPCFHGNPATELCDSRPDLNNAFVMGNAGPDMVNDRTICDVNNESSTADSPGVGNGVQVKGHSEGELDASEDVDVIITVDKIDISGLQARSTDLQSITENDLTKLLREVMAQARNLTQAERCSVFLIDDEMDELVAKVFDGISTSKDNEVLDEIRIPSTQGIAGHVFTSGELLNIKDAYSHPLFYRGIDDSTGFRTRNILCFPIKNESEKVMGVAQLCNKKTGPFFTQFDEDLATAFGIYCCISISHSLLYKKVIDSQVRNSLANELMMYHMKGIMYKKLQDSQHRKSLANELMIYHMQVSPEDVTGLTSVDIPHPRFLHPDFVEFSYAPRTLPDCRTLLACLSMFEDMNLISRFRIKRETLARFVLMVKKGYRNPPYHNWTHAYTVAQFCYQLVKNLKLDKFLEEIEIYALFVSCLCHDIDHRGTNNSFQTASKSVLAALYSSEGSVLERHHFAQTMCILNTEGCNIFEHLNSKEYQRVLDLVRDIILATDLAHHLKILKNIREMSVRGYNRAQKKDRTLLLCLLMTSCDLSDQTKPWDNTKNVAAMIYNEFFSQGDLEKASGFQPAEMMDRERAQIPEVQINFLDHIALPVYSVLAALFPDGNEINEAVENNKRHWEKIRNLIKLKRGGSCARMTFDEVIAIEYEEDDEVMEEGSSEQLNHTVSNGSG